MIYIETKSVHPWTNLAFEEYFLRNLDLGDDILMLWQNEPTIVVGRFQNTLEEINQDYTDTHGIHVIRRISGGGAVYHDLGNLCFSFILHGITTGMVDASRFARPVVQALAQFGIQAEVSGRNDLTIDGKKFSGNAMALQKQRLLFHGTLLYDTDLNVLGDALRVAPDKIESKGVKSVKSRVTNIKSYAPKDLTIQQFKETLKHFLLDGSESQEYFPTSQDLGGIQQLVEQKYQSWDWNFGSNPSSNVFYARRFSGGKIEAHLEIEKGYLQSCQFTGDFLGLCELDEVEQRLVGVRYTKQDVENALADVEFKKYFGLVSREEVIACMMGL